MPVFDRAAKNARRLVPAWYCGWDIRTALGRSFSKVTTVSGSDRYAGFIGHYNFASVDQGITRAFNWGCWAASYPLPPHINPAFSNNTTDPSVHRARMVNQELRPYPHCLTIATADQGGEKSDAG